MTFEEWAKTNWVYIDDEVSAREIWNSAVATERSSRGMFVARLENMQQNGDRWLTCESVLALLNDCDMLASTQKGALSGIAYAIDQAAAAVDKDVQLLRDAIRSEKKNSDDDENAAARRAIVRAAVAQANSKPPNV